MEQSLLDITDVLLTAREAGTSRIIGLKQALCYYTEHCTPERRVLEQFADALCQAYRETHAC